ncbi:DUF3459 domain-containing protein, partial [Pantoea septica]
HAGRVEHCEEGFIQVSWRFPAGTLSLALNIGEKTQPLPEQPGETIFAWPDNSRDLPQNAIVVRLAKGDAQ